MQITIHNAHGSTDATFTVVVKVEGARHGEWQILGIWSREYPKDKWDSISAAQDILSLLPALEDA